MPPPPPQPSLHSQASPASWLPQTLPPQHETHVPPPLLTLQLSPPELPPLLLLHTPPTTCPPSPPACMHPTPLQLPQRPSMLTRLHLLPQLLLLLLPQTRPHSEAQPSALLC